uniref:Uncharacterized protein n=1 Tax=Manihot esculenta TaxID=3983 RepID=A0A2C9VXN6_MANES
MSGLLQLFAADNAPKDLFYQDNDFCLLKCFRSLKLFCTIIFTLYFHFLGPLNVWSIRRIIFSVVSIV